MASIGSQNDGTGTDSARLLELELAKAQAEAKAAEAMAKARALEAALAQQQAAASVSEQDEKPAAEPKKAAVAVVAGLEKPRAAAEEPSAAQREFADGPGGGAAAATGKARRPSKPAEKPSTQRPKVAAAAVAVSAAATATTAAAAKPRTAERADGELEEERRGSLLGNWLRSSSSWMLSMVVHLLVLIILALFYLPMPDVGDLLPLMASVNTDELEELEELDMDEFEMDEMEALAFDVQDPGMAELGDTVELTPTDVEVATMSVSDTMDTIGTLFGEHGKGWASAGTGDGGAEFYGAKTRGTRFIFIIDNSLSMTQGRFESALYELMYTVGRMASDQEFYVFFFSDTAYPLFYPNTAQGMQKATPQNKQRLYQWLNTVQLVLRTDAKPAVQQAMAMQPHGIYILTDGAFTDDTGRFLLDKDGVEKFIKSKSDRYYRPPTIHTVGMEIKQPAAEKGLKDIATAYNGSFRLVRTNPQMAQVAQRNPRQRFKTPGPLWGIALGKARQPGARPMGGQKKPPAAGGQKKPGPGGGKKKK